MAGFEPDGSVTIVTGSATGIGAATARMLAAKGGNVVINYTRSAAEAEATAAACADAGGGALVVQSDVADDADCRRLVAACIDRWGRLDALVNNAGATKFVAADDFEGISGEDFLAMYAVNVVGAFQMTRAAAPHLKQRSGAVVNVSSAAAVTGVGSSIGYSASKAALNTMTLTLARTLAPEIRVNCVCPGLTDTRWNRAGLGDERYEAVLAGYERAAPLGRATTAEDIAEAVVWLIEGASAMTGEIIMIDSGTHLGFAPLVAR